MSAAQVRIGGVWVEVETVGEAWFSGVAVPFGPDAGYVEEVFTFPATNLPDNDDGAFAVLGTAFTPSADGEWVGNRVFTSATAPSELTTLAFNENTGTELGRSATLTTVPAGQHVDVMFTDPVDIINGINYLAVYRAPKYAANGGGMSWPYTTARLTSFTTNPSRWGYGALGFFPINSSSAGYLVSPIVRFPA